MQLRAYQGRDIAGIRSSFAGRGRRVLSRSPTGSGNTVQFSTALTNWSTLLVTNAPASSFTVLDPTAPGRYGFYRVLLGP